MRVLARLRDPEFAELLEGVAVDLDAEVLRIESGHQADEQLWATVGTHPDLVLVESPEDEELERLRRATRSRGLPLLVAARTRAEVERAVQAGADDWLRLPASAEELRARIRSARARAARREDRDTAAETAEHLRYEEMLYDRFTGFPTLPLMMEQGREILERNGNLTLLYVEFVRYSKLEEIYGWEKLDEVLQATAEAVREFYSVQQGQGENLLMVSHAGDDDFIFFSDLWQPGAESEQRINQIAEELETHIRDRLDREHGEDIAGLFSIYIGSTTIFRNPKIRTSRLIYRGIREAAHAARSVENRERTRKVADLKTALRDGAVYIVYHPIVITETREVYGYEALARGTNRALRSPEVMFGVAEEANLIWELSRLCRRRAIEGIEENLRPDQLLFLNIDPHDFRDPTFRYLDLDELGVEHPERIVLEITERTAITDYTKFQGYLKEFRERGFRFAVDDAGSGYAGLGSIANLEPDFIKLDISLIAGIDTNFMKQNLVETMVSFANDHGIQVIAEGVEREEEYEAVKALGVHLTQGFLFHEPGGNGKHGD
ncbi:MAG: EAL domain-containing response regulator [Gemmatimonadota bacterium]|nr:EAL domain-containing response regulator [Gemmatimonadota bacterium]